MRRLSLVPAFGLALACAVLAQPTINNNFVAQVAFKALNESIDVTLYDSYSANMARFDTSPLPNTKTVVFDFFKGAVYNCPLQPPQPRFTFKQSTQFTSVAGQCRAERIIGGAQHAPAFWDFLKDATNAGQCRVSGKSGQKWIHKANNPNEVNAIPIEGAREIVVCASENTPLSIQWLGKPDRNGNPLVLATMEFRTFAPGAPAASDFCLPAACLTRLNDRGLQSEPTER